MFVEYPWALPTIAGLLVFAGILGWVAFRRRRAAATGQLRRWQDWDYATEFAADPVVNVVVDLEPAPVSASGHNVETGRLLTISPSARLECWTSSGRSTFIPVQFGRTGCFGADAYKVKVGTLVLLHGWLLGYASNLPDGCRILLNGTEPDWQAIFVEAHRLGVRRSAEIGQLIRPGRYDPATMGG